MLLAKFEICDTNTERVQKTLWNLCAGEKEAQAWFGAQEFEWIDLVNDKVQSGSVSMGARGVLYAKTSILSAKEAAAVPVAQLQSLSIEQWIQMSSWIERSKNIVSPSSSSATRAPAKVPAKNLSVKRIQSVKTPSPAVKTQKEPAKKVGSKKATSTKRTTRY